MGFRTEGLKIKHDCLRFLKRCSKIEAFSKVLVEDGKLVDYLCLKLDESITMEAKLAAQILCQIANSQNFEVSEKFKKNCFES